MQLPTFVLVMPGFLAIGAYKVNLPTSVHLSPGPISWVLTLVLSRMSKSLCSVDTSFNFSFHGLKATFFLHRFRDSLIKGRFFIPVI